MPALSTLQAADCDSGLGRLHMSGQEQDSPKRIVVIGAGIVGVACAIRLREQGHEVTLVDRIGPGQATSSGNAGVLASSSVVPVTVPGLPRKAPGMAFDPESPLFLRWASLPAMSPWLVRYLWQCRTETARRISRHLASLVRDSLDEHQALAGNTRAARYIRPSEYVFAYANRSAFEADAFGWGLRHAAGFRWQEIEGRDLTAYDPLISGAYRFAVVLDEHGIITDPARYVAALAEHFSRCGGRILREEVVDFARDGVRLVGVRTRDAVIEADTAIVAAGVWSKRLARKVGLALPLESERGYHVEFATESQPPRAPTMLATAKFVATPLDGRIRCAGLVEFAGLDAPPNPAAFDYIETRARAAFPAAKLVATRRWMGHRPATVDSLPIIGASRKVPRIIFACGHHHVGLTSGPRTARLVAAIVAGESTDIDPAPYSPDRF